ncbi:hypothetical protein [Leifsonia poae]|uniref:Uncharacterized protein n=1 Tax=Leifsonia poae TaxID=110933 RepID=A0A9W6HAZ0_9MICO|nr:hypothetical protein [Leifsonia poae]GLJ76780.1 hypothetical protein GCM10017584_23540 [Leifsonia poae]
MSALDDAAIMRLRTNPLERTPQRLDPLGAQSAWLLVPVLSVISLTYAVYSTVSHAAQIVHPSLAWWAIIVLAVGGVVYSLRSYPGLAPFGRWSHLSVVAVTVVAACLFTASMWGHNERIQDDWGQIAVALVVTTMSLYRPISEVISVAAVAAVILGIAAAVQAPFLTITNASLVYASVAATPIIALACGGAGYAWTMTGETLAWREVARDGQARLEPELRDTAQRMVSQETNTTLNEATAPFLAAVLERGEITAADAERARDLATALRNASIAAVDRTWLGEALAQALAARGEDPRAVPDSSRVSDPDRLERALSDEQRAIVGAIISTVAKLPSLDPASVRIAAADPSHPAFALTCRTAEPRRQLRRELLPFLSALRSVGLNASLHLAGDELTLRFSYPGGENR